jgi:tetratricopeptide (TPR) repeat protein
MSQSRAFILSFWLLVPALGIHHGLTSAAYAQAKVEPKPVKAIDTRVEPTTWGTVIGRIYDARTGFPLKSAEISIEAEEGFLKKGKSTAVTDELGGYRAQAILGRVSENLDVGRALLSSGIGLLFGTATNTTRRIDVAQLNFQVKAAGYKVFEGPIPVRESIPQKFTVAMEPILMMPDGNPGESVCASQWSAVRIQSASTTPTIAKKGETVNLRTELVAFGKLPAKTVEVVAFSDLWKGAKKLKIVEGSVKPGLVSFETTYKVSGKEKDRVYPVYFEISKSTLDYDPDRSTAFALIQIGSSDSELQDSRSRLEGLENYFNRNYSAALEKLVAIAPKSQTSFDLTLKAYSAEQLNDFDLAADALVELSERGGTGYENLTDSVRVFYLDKRYELVEKVVSGELAKVKKKDQPKVIPANALGYYGLSLVKSSKLDLATKLNEDLLAWQLAGLDPAVIEFRGALRLAQVQAAHLANPGSSLAVADFGRALLDLGRFDEAVAKLQESLTLDPENQAVKRDLVWAALQYESENPPAADLNSAVEAARVALNIGKGKQESKDFASWNQYAVLLYALSERQMEQDKVLGEKTRDEAIGALRQSLAVGRKGAQRNSGAFSYAYGYMSGSSVAISGFAYPQANASFLLLQSLKKLISDPTNYLALLNQAGALLDLGQFQLAKTAATNALKLKPESLDAQFLLGLLAAKEKSYDEAKRLVSIVADKNPIHPRANLVLVDLLTEEGDLPGAAERLAIHTNFYGNTRR